MTFPCSAGQAFLRPLLFKYIFITQEHSCLFWNVQVFSKTWMYVYWKTLSRKILEIDSIANLFY